MDRRLGRPLPHQLPNPTRANPSAINLSPLRAYAALAAVSNGYSAPKGMFPRVTHPSAADPERSARLACIRPAASVRSEPGSNSQVQSTQHIYPQSTPALTSTHQRYIHQALIRQGRRIQPPQTHSIRPQQPYPTPPTNQQHTPVNTSTYHQSVGYSDTPYSTTPPIRQSIANTHTSNTPNKPAKPPTTYPFSQLTLCHTSGPGRAAQISLTTARLARISDHEICARLFGLYRSVATRWVPRPRRCVDIGAPAGACQTGWRENGPPPPQTRVGNNSATLPVRRA